MGSLGALPLRHFAVFESQFLLKYYTQKAKSVCIQFVSGMMHSLRKMLRGKCKQDSPIPTNVQFIQEINGK